MSTDLFHALLIVT